MEEGPKLEMYTPVGEIVVRQQPQKKVNKLVTWWQLLESAAKSRYGPDINVLRTRECEEELDRFVKDIEFTVINSDSEPLIMRPTVIDVTTKELVNLGKEKDETTVRVGKNLPICAGTRYHFSSTAGVNFERKYNFGMSIVSLAMTGGYMKIGTDNRFRDQAYNCDLMFNYYQEEKLTVLPRTKVGLKITTMTKKFRQNYTLEFSTPRTRYVTVSFETHERDCCWCCCSQQNPKQGTVYAFDILRTLPDFKDSGGVCSFTQGGLLTWIGESCNTEKFEVALQ